MLTKFKYLFLFFLINFFSILEVVGAEQFEFNVTEIEITQNGNLIKGLNRGTAITNDGVELTGDEFKYDKIENILEIVGNVKIYDYVNKYTIFSDKAIYYKNLEKILTIGNSKAINENLTITSNNFIYEKNLNIINANQNVMINDGINDYIIYSNNITYYKNIEKLFSEGITKGIIKSKYNFLSSNVTLLRNKKEIISDNKTKILDNKSREYSMSNFIYFIESELIKAENLEIIMDNTLKKEKTDYFNFSNGFFNLKDQEFISEYTKIFLKKDSYNIIDNDPRLYGVSSKGSKNETIINKGVFTSCQKIDGKCPPWSIKAEKIVHDKKKKQLKYDNAFFRVYDVPVLYFPKFFHPDPSVKRQSGFLIPQLNKSEILGTSIYLPYFHVISDNKDITFKPTIFDKDILMFQNEYRQENENSSFIADFSFTKGYKSTLSNNKNSISHLFLNYETDLKFSNYITSNLNLKVEKTTNDTYLKVFDTNLIDTSPILKPKNSNILSNRLEVNLIKDNFDFTSGIEIYENLTINEQSDRYQFVLPYYNFSKNIFSNIYGNINFFSSGDNYLSNTNNLRTRIINDFNFNSYDYYTNKGFKNNFNIYLKNLNTVAKNDDKYKNSPQVEILNIYQLNTSLPLIKENNIFKETLEPKISFKFNPTDMINYSNSSRTINTNNIFDINRLGLSDTFESGRSLTLGIDYKKEKKENIINTEDINEFFEFKLATVIKDKTEKFIPTNSTLNRKTSNIFGTINNKFSEQFNISYDFAIDNDLSSFDYNSITTEFMFDNFNASLNFTETNGLMGRSNVIESSLAYNFDEKNILSFSTRKNREINLTEYYDLVYQYKNDCLTAGVKYKKTYYQDRDLKPKEDLLLSFTFYPLTTYEQKIDQNLYRN